MSSSSVVSLRVSYSEASAQATSSDGCVVCSSDVTCPNCAEGYYCVLTALTCYECPTTYCELSTNSESSNSTSSSTSSSDQNSGRITGAIVGSVVGGVLIIIGIVMYFFYTKFWKLRRETKFNSDIHKSFGALLDADYDEDLQDMYDADLDNDDFDDMDDDIEDGYFKDELIEMGDTVPELMEFPKNAKRSKLNHSNNTHDNNRSEIVSIVTDLNHSRLLQSGNRSSSSTINTKASNILPIAYIPGVTNSDPQRRGMHSFQNMPHSRDTVKSHITLGSSIFDNEDGDPLSVINMGNDEDKIGNNSISREKINPNTSTEKLTTAIRAKPRLIDIHDNNSLDDLQNSATSFGNDEEIELEIHIDGEQLHIDSEKNIDTIVSRSSNHVDDEAGPDGDSV
ncbi:hypothetical protein TPHA_0A03480 [Tetrapisispora phaffii CBS 4417]|uniref:Membrane anchor Opy2 N-terminal domain-containing protein n=1 Tax=Tetrapisispora phaffii (strain ATCC 24235 / CBS 4417 / NBRC 1672 / NRRL Y-8282 / UCD 70-5) TaxID=1071381 RepID=G8BNE7_TETPH|nr:hypothetical protein TPHA_0A03480 [Tetrapisispora phaffii CBS 4417]CCE61425.1 hypothetical protein TPHA_0A03480 [Tetrapisispora phaffii CBS 4417]